MKHIRYRGGRICLALLALVLAFAAVSAFTTPVSAKTKAKIPNPEAELYYYDSAGVMSNETKRHVVTTVLALKEVTGGEIVAAAIDFVPQGYGIDEYAYEWFNEWGIGDANRNNGLLLLFAVGEDPRKAWVAEGDGLDGTLKASTIETILSKNFYDDLDAGNYDRAVVNTVDALAAEIYAIYPVSQAQSGKNNNAAGDNYNYNYDYDYGYSYDPPRTAPSFIDGLMDVVVVIVIVIIFILVLAATTAIRGFGYGRRRYYRQYGNYDGYYNGYYGFWGYGRPRMHRHHYMPPPPPTRRYAPPPPRPMGGSRPMGGPRPNSGGFGGGFGGGHSSGGGFGGGRSSGGGAGRK